MTEPKQEQKLLLVYCEAGSETLVLECSSIPSSNTNTKDDIQAFINQLNPKQKILCQGVEISLASKGLLKSVNEKYGDEGNIFCDILFLKGVHRTLPSYFHFEYFDYSDGYILLSFLSRMYDGIFKEWVFCSLYFLFCNTNIINILK